MIVDFLAMLLIRRRPLELSLASTATTLLVLAVGCGSSPGVRELERAGAHLEEGRLESALANYDQALDKLPPDGSHRVHALTGRGRTYEQLGRYPQALRDYTRAIESAPDRPVGYMLRANVHIRLKQCQQAIADANTALALDPNLAPAYFVRGTCRYRQGLVELARSDLERAIAIAPDSRTAITARVLLMTWERFETPPRRSP